MNRLKTFYLKNELFSRIFIILFLCILLVTIVVSIISIRFTQKNYLEIYQKSNDITLEKLQSDFESLHSSIFKIFSNLEENNVEAYFSNFSDSPQEELVLTRNFQKSVTDTAFLFENIPSNLVILGANGKTFFQNSALKTKEIDWNFLEDLQKRGDLLQNKTTYFFSEHGITQNTKNEMGIFFIHSLLNKHNQNYGYAIIFLEEKYLQDWFNSLIDKHLNQIVVLNHSGTIITSNNNSLIGKKDSNLLTISKDALSSSPKYLKEGTDLITTKKIYSLNFALVSTINTKVLVKNVELFPSLITLALITIIIIAIIAYYIIRKTTQPIYQLVNDMRRTSTNHFTHFTSVSGTYEIQSLANSYNEMLLSIHSYIQQVKDVEEEKRLVELHSLQMQIQPHFIYNTLTVIKFLIWQNEDDKAIKALDAFIALLQTTIGNKDEIITIEDEIINCLNYVTILHTRFGDNINIQWFIPDHLKTFKIPKMILQPVIENAFLHAFPDNRNTGLIQVLLQEFENDLIFEIIDNGIGMPQTNLQFISKKKEKRNHFSGIGLTNIHERLQLLYGKEYGIEVFSMKEIGTTIKIKLSKLT